MKMRDLMNIITEDSIAYRRDGFPVEMHSDEDIQKEIAAGHLTAGTEVTIYSGNHVSGHGTPVMKKAGEVEAIAKHLPKEKPARTILSFEEHGIPTELYDEGDITRAIERGALTADTDVTVSRPDQRPQLVKASRVTLIAKHFD